MNSVETYRRCLGRSERRSWRVEELIGNGKSLDFGRPFLPAKFAGMDMPASLSPKQSLALNQISAHTYLSLFGLFEEMILPFILDHVRDHFDGDDYRVRAFLAFAAEEAKHIHLFRCFREEFRRGFGHELQVIGPAAEIARGIFAFPPLAVALITLHIEWMTQRHYLDSVRGNASLDPMFASLLKHHWMEEVQHALLDAVMVETLADGMSQVQIDAGIEGYLAI